MAVVECDFRGLDAALDARKSLKPGSEPSEIKAKNAAVAKAIFYLLENNKNIADIKASIIERFREKKLSFNALTAVCGKSDFGDFDYQQEKERQELRQSILRSGGSDFIKEIDELGKSDGGLSVIAAKRMIAELNGKLLKNNHWLVRGGELSALLPKVKCNNGVELDVSEVVEEQNAALMMLTAAAQSQGNSPLRLMRTYFYHPQLNKAIGSAIDAGFKGLDVIDFALESNSEIEERLKDGVKLALSKHLGVDECKQDFDEIRSFGSHKFRAVFNASAQLVCGGGHKLSRSDSEVMVF